jgi:hypothetical protein
MSQTTSKSKPRMTRRQMGQFLRDNGFPIGDGTLDRICSPAQSKGPPVSKYWNARPLYDADEVLAWAEARLTDEPRSFSRDGSRKPRKQAVAVEHTAGEA